MSSSNPSQTALRLCLKTPVKKSVAAVWAGFDDKLFIALAPPFPPVRLLRFEGCLKGDVVSLELNFFLAKIRWTSLITDSLVGAEESFFIDEGTELPFFLAYWKHRHILKALPNGGTVIIDDITFSTPFRWLNYLMYPLLWLQFAYRKPIYRRIFS